MTTKELEQMVEIYGTSVYSFCCYLTGSTQAAEDLYQNVLLQALEIRDKIVAADGNDLKEKYRQPKNYLLGIAVRLWKKERTKQAKKAVCSLDDPGYTGQEPADGEDVLEEVEKKEMFRTLYRIVAGLPEKWKTIVLLFYTGEMKEKEIGKILRIPVGTVKSRLYHARRQIRKEMEDEGYEI